MIKKLLNFYNIQLDLKLEIKSKSDFGGNRKVSRFFGDFPKYIQLDRVLHLNPLLHFHEFLQEKIPNVYNF